MKNGLPSRRGHGWSTAVVHRSGARSSHCSQDDWPLILRPGAPAICRVGPGAPSLAPAPIHLHAAGAASASAASALHGLGRTDISNRLDHPSRAHLATWRRYSIRPAPSLSPPVPPSFRQHCYFPLARLLHWPGGREARGRVAAGIRRGPGRGAGLWPVAELAVRHRRCRADDQAPLSP